MRDGAIVAGYRAAAAAVRLVPMAALEPISEAAGRIAVLPRGARVEMLEHHLRRVCPDLDRRGVRSMAARSMGSYARYWIESFRLPHVSATEIERWFRHDGFDEHVLGGLEAGRGVILALPHLGGWEWAGRWLAEQGHRVTVVVEAVHPPALFAWFVGLRESLGMNVIALGPSAGSQVLRALKANHIVCLMSDRDIAGGGVDVEFFGERTTLPGGPATLALRTGAPLLPAAVYFDGRGRVGTVLAPLSLERTDRMRADVARVTQQLARSLETLIRRAPEQWHLLQPNWPSDPGYGT